jgi:transketolase
VACTYATFATLRAAEFVRTDLAYNQRNVKLIGTLAGVAFGQGGPTHHAVEDLALLRAVPGLTIMCPSDGQEAASALATALTLDGPVYLRIGRIWERPSPTAASPFSLAPRVLRQGDAAAVLAYGSSVADASQAAERLGRIGVSVRVINVVCIKPLTTTALLEAIGSARHVVTVEDHSIVGGLGSAVAEALAEAGWGSRLKRLGHPDRWLGMGVSEDLAALGGFDEDAVVTAVAELCGVPVPSDQDWGDRF